MIGVRPFAMRNLSACTALALLAACAPALAQQAKTASDYVMDAVRKDRAEGAWAKATEGWHRDANTEPAAWSGTPAADEEAFGAVVYRRPWIYYTFDRSVPRPAERKAKFHVRLTPGEKEPMSVCLYGLGDHTALAVTTTDLQGPGGSAIPASAVTVYTVVSLPMPWRWEFKYRPTERDEKVYDNVPQLLLELPKGVDAAKGTSRQFILDVHAPKDAKPGIYSGTFTVASDRGKIVRPWSVEVLPFPLADPGSKWVRGVYQGAPADEAEYRMLRDFGFNGIAYWWAGEKADFGKKSGVDKDGKPNVRLFYEGRWQIGPQFALCKKYGMRLVWFLQNDSFGVSVKNRWGIEGYPSAEYKRTYVATAKAIIDKIKEAGFEPPILCVQDEPLSHDFDRSMTLQKLLYDAMGDLQYWTVLHVKGGHKRLAGRPYCNLWVSNNADPEKYAAAMAGGAAFGTYKNGNMYRKVAGIRYHSGWRNFYFHGSVFFSWANRWNYGAGNGPENLYRQINAFLGGREGSYHTSSLKTPAGMVPLYCLLAMREGFDDRLYAETAKSLPGTEGFIRSLRAKIFDKMKPGTPYNMKNLPDWYDPFTHCQQIQDQDDCQPAFLDGWRAECIAEILKHVERR